MEYLPVRLKDTLSVCLRCKSLKKRMVCIINSVNPGPETHKGGPWVPVVPKLDVIMLIISLLIVNRIGNNRNHREGTCETLRCTVFLLV